MNSKNNVPEEKVVEYLKTHSIKCTMKDLHVGWARVQKIIKKYEIPIRDSQEEARLTKMQWYGDPTYNNRQSAAQTKLEKYGSETYCNPDKIKSTKMDRYSNPTYVNPDKAKQTNLERYGTTCSLGNPEVAKKARQNTLNRFGSPCYFTSEDFKEKYNSCHKEWEEKTRQTVLSKYGKPYYFMTEEGKEKIKQTIQDKYGVDYFCQTSECRKHSNNSKPNQSFASLLESYGIPYSREFAINGKSYDFIVNQNTLVEINPTPTHNSTWNPFGNHIEKQYHKSKQELAVQNGYKFIAVWDWDDMDKIAKSFISRDTYYARNCIIKEIGTPDTAAFLNKYHFQSYAKSSIQIGLYNGAELLSIMTFGKPRYNKNYDYELIRYCSCANVVGGAEKLFSYFIKNYSPNSIISYCDFSKFTGKMYEGLGFSEIKSSTPSKHWYNIKSSRHITDNLLRQLGFDKLLGNEYGRYGKGTNNETLMLEHGFVEVYDCGQGTFTWTSTNK